MNFANEGKLVIVADKAKTAEILTALRRHPLGENAAVIGEVTTDGKVRAVGLFGQSRLLDLPRNEPYHESVKQKPFNLKLNRF